MKKIIYLFVFINTFISCNYLDKMPDDQKTMDMVWKSQKETEAYLYNIYSQLPNEMEYWDHCPWVGASDEADMFWERYLTAQINKGNWNPSTPYYNPWPNYYKAIRCTFVFEKNVDKCFELSETLKKQYKAEVKFLRGFYYWKLLQQYGPFVLLEDEIPLESDMNIPRTPYDKCVEYICKMLDEAEKDLPWSWKDDTKWLGKPDKIACKAVKSDVLLMAASPLWNGNLLYKDFKNLDGTQLVNIEYSEKKWIESANAAKDLIQTVESKPELGIKLYRNDENGDDEFNPYKSVRDLFLVKWNCETLWSTTKHVTNNIIKHCTLYPGGWNGVAPTQRLVDAFYMNNGRTIDDDLSGYEEVGFADTPHPNWKEDNIDNVISGDSWGHRIGERKMFANREARFYASILYNGRPLPQVSKDDRNVYSSSNNQDGWGRVELYGKGLSGAVSGFDHSKTGYLNLKGVHPESNPYRNQYADVHNFMYIRLAGIYLNYIESLNEYDPENPEIKYYWDKIRERAGLPSIFDTYPEIFGDKEKQLCYILRERQIELCFEGDRYFTTRRRLLSDKVDTSHTEDRRMFGDNGPMYGLNIMVGDSFSSEEFYTRTPFENRVFDKKMYIWPISQYEIDRNNLLVQNPWW